MFIQGFIETIPHLRLPLYPVTFLNGDAGHGMSAPVYLPFDGGLIVTRKGLLSAHSYDFGIRLWAQPVEGWPEAVDYQDSIFIESMQQRTILGFNKYTGNENSRVSIPAEGFLQAVSKRGPIIRHKNKDRNLFEAFDWSGCSLWRHSSCGTVIPTPGICLIRENLGESLVGLDDSTGTLIWRFSAAKSGDRDGRDTSNEIWGGYPSVVVLGDRVLVVVVDGRVFSLDRRTGEVLSQGRTPVNGSFQVTPTSIFFAQPFCFSEFDHREMREVNRIEYRDEVQPLYGNHAPTLNAFCFSEEAVIWTTMHGALMGVSREPCFPGKRTTWIEQKAHVLMPLAVPPLIWGNHMYFRQTSDSVEYPCGLICYRGSS